MPVRTTYLAARFKFFCIQKVSPNGHYISSVKVTNPAAALKAGVDKEVGMAGFNIKDIAGLGEVVGHVKDFLLKIIETLSMREERRLRNENLRLDNTRKFLDIAKEYDLSLEQVKYYENLVNGPYAEPVRTEVHVIKAVDHSPRSQVSGAEFSKAQPLSKR